MSTEREKAARERREQLPMEQRTVEALEMIADQLSGIRNELLQIRFALPKKSGF